MRLEIPQLDDECVHTLTRSLGVEKRHDYGKVRRLADCLKKTRIKRSTYELMNTLSKGKLV